MLNIKEAKIVRRVAIVCDTFFVFVLNFFIFVRSLKQLAIHKDIVVLTEGGFGHTVITPDISYRLFKKKCLVFILSTRNRHNWELGRVWVDIKVIHLWKHFFIYSKKQSVLVSLTLLFTLYKILHKRVHVATRDPELLDSEKYYLWREPDLLYDAFVKYEIAAHGKIHQPFHEFNEYVLYWSRAVFENPMLSIRLPENVMRGFLNKIDSIVGQNLKILVVYMRYKGTEGDGLTRCGGQFDDYRAIFEKAKSRGLAILVVGDRCLDDCPSDLAEFLYDAKKLKYDRNWFNIAAIIACDYFIGDPGGGSLLPCLLNKPKLMVNAFPYSQVWPGFLFLYKRVANVAGEEVPLRKCFDDYAWTYDFMDGYKLRNNNNHELSMAVDELFSVPSSCWQQYISETNYSLMSKYSRVGARLCQAQLEVK